MLKVSKPKLADKIGFQYFPKDKVLGTITITPKNQHFVSQFSVSDKRHVEFVQMMLVECQTFLAAAENYK